MCNWIVVASAEHAQRGLAAGFMQACHGKAAPLRRVQPGDRVACYSPTLEFRGTEKCRAFTAFGTVRAGEAYQADMGGGFRPFRRDVDWADASPAPIQPLLARLDFTAGRTNWGYQFRFGLFRISDADMSVIAEAMGVAALPRAALAQTKRAETPSAPPASY
jgi:hypothetical protein